MNKLHVLLKAFTLCIFLGLYGFNAANAKNIVLSNGLTVHADIYQSNGGCYDLHILIYNGDQLVAYGNVWFPEGCNKKQGITISGQTFVGESTSDQDFANYFLLPSGEIDPVLILAENELMHGNTERKALSVEIVGVDYTVYPNPADNSKVINIQFNFDLNTLSDNVTICLYNAAGQLFAPVKVDKEHVVKNIFQLHLPSALPTGYYDLAILDNNKAIGHRALSVR